MNLASFRPILLGIFLFVLGCDGPRSEPVGQAWNLVHPLESNSSTYLHSSRDGTDLVVFGSSDPLAIVSSADLVPFLAGKVLSDGSTAVYFGTYDLDSSGHGAAHIAGVYERDVDATSSLISRRGATRTDYPAREKVPLEVAQSASGLRIRIGFSFGATDFGYTALDQVVAAIDTSGTTAHHDAFQLTNFALLLSEVRISAFGGAGITKYVSAPQSWNGLVDGQLTFSVGSITNLTTTIEYAGYDDLRGVWLDGTITSATDLDGDGSMAGLVTYEHRRRGDPSDVVLSGSIDYRDVILTNGLPQSGDFIVSIDGIPGDVLVPHTAAANVELTNILPATP